MAKRKHARDAAVNSNQTPTESMADVEFSNNTFEDDIQKRDTKSPKSKGEA